MLQFLYESSLIDKGKCIVNLRGATLHGAALGWLHLSGADLSNANLWRADLGGPKLSEAILITANLHGAILYGAKLSGAILKDATGITTEQLDKAKSLKGATMPDGSIHPYHFL